MMFLAQVATAAKSLTGVETLPTEAKGALIFVIYMLAKVIMELIKGRGKMPNGKVGTVCVDPRMRDKLDAVYSALTSRDGIIGRDHQRQLDASLEIARVCKDAAGCLNEIKSRPCPKGREAGG